MSEPISELRSVTYHMGSHSVTCHPTEVNAPCLNPSQIGRYSIYLPRRDGRLSWPRRLVYVQISRSGVGGHWESLEQHWGIGVSCPAWCIPIRPFSRFTGSTSPALIYPSRHHTASYPRLTLAFWQCLQSLPMTTLTSLASRPMSLEALDFNSPCFRPVRFPSVIFVNRVLSTSYSFFTLVVFFINDKRSRQWLGIKTCSGSTLSRQKPPKKSTWNCCSKLHSFSVNPL